MATIALVNDLEQKLYSLQEQIGLMIPLAQLAVRQLSQPLPPSDEFSNNISPHIPHVPPITRYSVRRSSIDEDWGVSIRQAEEQLHNGDRDSLKRKPPTPKLDADLMFTQAESRETNNKLWRRQTSKKNGRRKSIFDEVAPSMNGSSNNLDAVPNSKNSAGGPQKSVGTNKDSSNFGLSFPSLDRLSYQRPSNKKSLSSIKIESGVNASTASGLEQPPAENQESPLKREPVLKTTIKDVKESEELSDKPNPLISKGETRKSGAQSSKLNSHIRRRSTTAEPTILKRHSPLKDSTTVSIATLEIPNIEIHDGLGNSQNSSMNSVASSAHWDPSHKQKNRKMSAFSQMRRLQNSSGPSDSNFSMASSSNGNHLQIPSISISSFAAPYPVSKDDKSSSDIFITQSQKSVGPIASTNTISRSLSRQASQIMHHITKEKYNVRGSLASIEAASITEEVQAGGKRTIFDLFFKVGLNPRSSLAVNWEFFTAIIYGSIIWVIPMIIGFEVHIDWSYSVVLTLVLAVDILFEFSTFRFSEVVLVGRNLPTLKDWQMQYVKTRLLIDVATALPFELMPIANYQYLWLIRLIRIYKLPKIITNSPLFIKLRKRLVSFLGIAQTFSTVFSHAFVLSAFLHLQACALFWAGRLNMYSNDEIAGVVTKSVSEKYIWALFTATGNTFPIIYKPSTITEKFIVLSCSIVGATLYAGIVGTVSSIAMGVDASGRLYKQKMDELKDYMRWKDLNEITRRKVMKYYEIKYRGKYFEEATLLNEMNESLRMEISTHNCRQLISKVPFLRREIGDGRDETFTGRIATALVPCYFVAGNVIISAGDTGSEMYFILTGTVYVIVNGEKVGQLGDGAFFGELALIANIPRTATVQAATSCCIYRLTRTDFTKILAEFEDMQDRINVIYNERMEKAKFESQVRQDLAKASPSVSLPRGSTPSLKRK